MILPTVHGNYPQQDFYLYTACDSAYFDEFGVVLVNSLHAHCDLAAHIHLFNPSDQQLHWLSTQSNVTATYEHVSADVFANAAARFNPEPVVEPLLDQYRRTKTAMTKGLDHSLLHRMQKTYYACARFIRLASMRSKNSTVLCIDVDAVIRRPIQQLSNSCDFYIHRISGKKARFLAGGIQLNPSDPSHQFIQEYSQALTTALTNDCVYWGLDQDLLENIASRYQYQQLPSELIDWDMRSSSVIWTAKGTRKSLPTFVNECAKYKT